MSRSTPTIEVLGISTVAVDEHNVLSSTENKSSLQSRLRLHGRITVFDQDGSFDKVKIRLRGAIRSRIGQQVAVERLPSSTEVRSNLDFKPVYSASRQPTDEQHLDFVCAIPSMSDRRDSSDDAGLDGRRQKPSFPSDMLDNFVPSMTVSGSTYITRVTALKDRHLVQGSCEVLYWLEAQFFRSGSREVIRKLSCPVDMSSLAMPMEVELSSSSSSLHADGTDYVEQHAKPQQGRSMNRFFTASHSHPELSIHLPKHLGYLISDSSSLATGCRRLTIPVTVDVVLPPPSHSNSHSQLTQRRQGEQPTQSPKCSIKTKWFTRKTFSTGPAAIESVVHNTTVSSQDLVVTLPPLYSSAMAGSDSSSTCTKYSTSMEMDLLLPESVTTPSVSTELLDIAYTLDLSMKFESEDMLKVPYVAHLSLPVKLRAAQPYSVVGPYCLDPLLGYIDERAEELLYAPPPYVP